MVEKINSMEMGLMVQLSIGTACNNCCIMCTNIMPPPANAWDGSTEELEKVILDNSMDSSVSITGGEPTIRSDLFHLLRLIKETMPNSRAVLLTNGRMFCYPKFTKEFIETGCDAVAIPLHAENAELHNAITRVPGSFEQTVAGVMNLLHYKDKVDVEIRVVIHKLNYKHLPAIARFISKEFKGIKRVVLFPIDFTGNANLNRGKLLVKILEVKPHLEKGLAILEKNGFEFSLYHVPFCIVDEKYWKNIPGRTVEERRITFKPCEGCVMKEGCPGVWKTYAFRAGTSEFKPITASHKKKYKQRQV